MNVYLVTGVGKHDGTVFAVMASEEDADSFAEALFDTGINTEVEERTLIYGQPSIRGYNK